jgi:hypothetical protein
MLDKLSKRNKEKRNKKITKKTSSQAKQGNKIYSRLQQNAYGFRNT